MIELKQNKIWSDSLSTTLGLAKPWDELEKPLRKFICFGEGGDDGGPGGDGDSETDVEFGEPTAAMTTSEAISATTAADAVGGLAGIGEAADEAATVKAIKQMDPIPKGLDKPHAEFLGLGYTFSPKAAELYGAPTYSNLGFSFLSILPPPF